jgi:hypothetical protein
MECDRLLRAREHLAMLDALRREACRLVHERVAPCVQSASDGHEARDDRRSADARGDPARCHAPGCRLRLARVVVEHDPAIDDLMISWLAYHENLISSGTEGTTRRRPTGHFWSREWTTVAMCSLSSTATTWFG